MAFNDTWTGAISTDWNTAANWNTAPSTPATAPPTSTDTINAGSGTDTVAGSGALESATLTLSSTGAGSVDLTGSYYTGYNSGSLNLTGQSISATVVEPRLHGREEAKRETVFSGSRCRVDAGELVKVLVH
jgi:hypothetical protein